MVASVFGHVQENENFVAEIVEFVVTMGSFFLGVGVQVTQRNGATMAADLQVLMPYHEFLISWILPRLLIS